MYCNSSLSSSVFLHGLVVSLYIVNYLIYIHLYSRCKKIEVQHDKKTSALIYIFFNYLVLLRFSDKLAVNLSYIVVFAGSTPSLKQCLSSSVFMAVNINARDWSGVNLHIIFHRTKFRILDYFNLVNFHTKLYKPIP